MTEQAQISVLFRFVFQAAVGFKELVKRSSRLVLPLTGNDMGRIKYLWSLYIEVCSHNLTVVKFTETIKLIEGRYTPAER